MPTVQDKKSWDKQQARRGASFFQSSLWGEFQQAIGRPPHFLKDDSWSCLLIERRTPFGKYLFAPYGPTVSDIASLPAAITEIKKYAKDAGFDWLTIEPIIPSGDNRPLRETLARLGARTSDHNREPDMTRVVDLSLAPDVILASISQSTRSLIRKNQREGFLSFQTSSDPADISIFTAMLGQVTKRNSVNFFSDEYFQTQAKLLMPQGMMHLELALHANKPIAAAIFHDFAGVSAYTYAGSLPEARQTSASALLLYQAMLNAKARGIKKLDLFGIAPDDAPLSHPWQGFSSFKKKFGGEVVMHAGTWDIPLTPRYRLNRAAKRGRKLLKRH